MSPHDPSPQTNEPQPHISMVIPVYNEREALALELERVIGVLDELGEPYEVIVVDDGSTDDCCQACEAFPEVIVLQHETNRGTGAARTTGTRAARGELLLMTDADGTYPAESIPELVAALETCDMVIGDREREMGTMKWLRTLAKEFIRLLASYMTQTKIPDLNSGLRGMRRELVLRYLNILPTTHSWVSTITMAFLSDGLRVRWVPISYHKRIGKSTFHPVTDTYNYLMLVMRAIMYFNPLRIFLPVTLFLATVGFGKAIYDIFAYNFHFAPSTVMLILTSVQLGAIGLLADLIVRRSRR